MNTRIKLYQVLMELTAEKYSEHMAASSSILSEKEKQVIYYKALEETYANMTEVLYLMRE